MRAAVLYSPLDVRVEDVADASEPVGHEVRVRVAFNGICGSDLHLFYRGEVVPGLLSPTLPRIIGHEYSGVVESVGTAVRGLRAGDRVAVRPSGIPCGQCDSCHRGYSHLCESRSVHSGGLSELVTLPEPMLFRLPDSFTLEMGALVEPMSVGVEAAKRSGVQGSQSAVVFGAGPIGLSVMLVLGALGVSNITVVEPSPVRQATAARLGANIVIDPSKGPVGEQYRDLVGGGALADVAFECSGKVESLLASFEVSRPRARIVRLGVYEDDVEVNLNLLCTSERELVGSWAYAPGAFEQVISLMSDGVWSDFDWVEKVEISELGRGVFDRLRSATMNKVLVDLGGS